MHWYSHIWLFFNWLLKVSLQHQCFSCLANAFKYMIFFITISSFSTKKWIVSSLSQEVNQIDTLNVPCDWLFAAHDTLSGAQASELISNLSWQNAYSECYEPAEPYLSKPCWICMVLSTLLWNSEFVLLTSCIRSHVVLGMSQEFKCKIHGSKTLTM